MTFDCGDDKFKRYEYIKGKRVKVNVCVHLIM